MINFKVELKFKWTNHCGLAEAGIENSDANSNNIISIMKDKNLHAPVVTLLAKDNQKLSKLLSKESERSVY